MSAEIIEQEVSAWSGDQLRAARQRMGLTPEQVERQLFFQPGYVDAIEEGNFKRLPGALFVKGYIRAYAKLLHISSHQLLQEFQVLMSQHSPSPDVEVKSVPTTKAVWEQKVVPSHQGIRWHWWALLPLVVLVLAAMWWPQITPAINRWLEPLHLSLPSTPLQPLITSTSQIPQIPQITAVAPVMEGGAAEFNDVEKSAAMVAEQAPAIGDALILETPEVAVPALAITEPEVAPVEGVVVNVLEDGRWQIGDHDVTRAMDQLQIQFKSTTKLEVADAAGVHKASKSYAAGAQLSIDGQAPFTLSIGDIKAVQMQFNQRDVSL